MAVRLFLCLKLRPTAGFPGCNGQSRFLCILLQSAEKDHEQVGIEFNKWTSEKAPGQNLPLYLKALTEGKTFGLTEYETRLNDRINKIKPVLHYAVDKIVKSLPIRV